MPRNAKISISQDVQALLSKKERVHLCNAAEFARFFSGSEVLLVGSLAFRLHTNPDFARLAQFPISDVDFLTGQIQRSVSLAYNNLCKKLLDNHKLSKRELAILKCTHLPFKSFSADSSDYHEAKLVRIGHESCDRSDVILPVADLGFLLFTVLHSCNFEPYRIYNALLALASIPKNGVGEVAKRFLLCYDAKVGQTSLPYGPTLTSFYILWELYRSGGDGFTDSVGSFISELSGKIPLLEGIFDGKFKNIYLLIAEAKKMSRTRA